VSEATASLIEDRGEAAVGSEFFRSREFLDAEGATHTLRIQNEDGVLLAPLIVREIEGTGERDAVSPYGYPGLAGEEDRGGLLPDPLASLALSVRTKTPPVLDPGGVDFSGTGLVSIFIRHRLGPSPLAGATERNVVQIADPALPRKSRPSDRRQVRRNLEAGYELELVLGSETTPEQRAGFLDVYEQTMRRTGAATHYFFGAGYFERILEAERTWLILARGPEGDLAAASIAVVSDGYLHYYLSGSADSHLRAAPMKNVVTRLVEFAVELGLPLNLGGGISPGDALEEFKRGFANRRQAWLTSELICDERRYEELAAGRSAGSFFPAYRA
jgi:GNAT acetyltransferase-like protein